GQAVDAPALVVERDERWHAGSGGVQVGHQPAELGGRADVALEEDDAARAVLGEELARLAVEEGPRQADHEELARGAAEQGGRHGLFLWTQPTRDVKRRAGRGRGWRPSGRRGGTSPWRGRSASARRPLPGDSPRSSGRSSSSSSKERRTRFSGSSTTTRRSMH